MKIILRSLKENEESSVFEMFNDIPATENGFGHKLNALPRARFDQKISVLVEESKSTNIEDGKVPQTYLILFIDDIPVGFAKLRHRLTPELLKHGGHIGFGISPKYRNKGYAKILLSETLKKAKELNINKILVTCDDDNPASYKTIEGCNGILDNVENNIRSYWIQL